MKTDIQRGIAALKPRNVFARFGLRRAAGAHVHQKRPADTQRKDLVQRLREAGL